MITINFSYKTSKEGNDLISSMEKNYSHALRVIYNNLELMEDPSFKKNMRKQYGLSEKLYELICKQAITWDKKWKKRKENLQNIIEKKEEKLKNESRGWKRDKINRDKQRLESRINKEICFGGSDLAKDLTQNPHDQSLRKKWRDKRTHMMEFMGTAGKKGNRFFHFDQLSKGIITFKPEGKKEKPQLSLHVQSKKQWNLLHQLDQLANEKKLSLSIGLSSSHICISYDESIVAGTHFDKNAFIQEMKTKGIDEKEERRKFWRTKYKEHEEMILRDKKRNRYLSMDLNPLGIGLVVMDRLSNDPIGEYKIIEKRFYDWSILGEKKKVASNDKKHKKQNNKRKHEISHVIKDIFDLAKQYKVANIVMEELDLEGNEDKGNKEGNRKINNVWHLDFIKHLIDKRININGYKKIEVNPIYSSFIGNIMHDEYDPVAASIELGRRGMTKYIGGSTIYPEFDMGWVISEWGSCLPQRRHDDLISSLTWKDVWNVFSYANSPYFKGKKRNKGVSVRISLDKRDYSAKWMDHEKSQVKVLTFP